MCVFVCVVVKYRVLLNKLPLNSHQSSCLFLPSAAIIGEKHHGLFGSGFFFFFKMKHEGSVNRGNG